jgi:hypothetical protein
MEAKKAMDAVGHHVRQLKTQRRFMQTLLDNLGDDECLIYIDWAATYGSKGRPLKDLIFAIRKKGGDIDYVHYMYNQTKEEKSGVPLLIF